MKEVKAYESIDGSIHPTRLKSLEQDHFFELRAFFQQKNQRPQSFIQVNHSSLLRKLCNESAPK